MTAALDPRVIEREIARIREKESNPYSSGTKTNLFTLLIFRSERVDVMAPEDHVEKVLQFLLGRRPARIITLTRARAAATEAWVSGRCFPDKRNRGVCFEEVRIESGDDGVGADPGAWSPLLIRDLPVFAWMPDDPSEATWRSGLAGAASLVDKVLVDSTRSAGDGVEALRDLAGIAGAGSILADFAWSRTRVLREQSARAFDPADMRPRLAAVKGVRLYGGSPGEAALFFLWLENRLGRGLKADHAWTGPLTEGFRVTFFLDGEAGIDIGCTRGGCISLGDEKSAYRFLSDGEILLDEVDSLSRDPVFDRVIASGAGPDA